MEYKGEASWKRRRNVVGLGGGHGGRGMSERRANHSTAGCLGGG